MDIAQKHKELGEEPIGKLLWKFSLPGIVGMLVNSLYNVVDRIFIGNGVNSDAIGGLTVAFPLMIITMAISMLFGVGVSSLMSIKLGEHNKEAAEKLLGHGFVLLILAGIIPTIIGLPLLEPLLVLFGARGNILQPAIEYTYIILIGNVGASIGFGMNNFIRAEGSPKMAMVTMLISAIINIVLDYIFIFPLQMGVAGAALATIIAQAVSAVWVLYFFIGYPKATLRLKKQYFKLQLSLVKRITAIGMAPFLLQLCQSLLIVIINHSINIYAANELEAGLYITIIGVTNSIIGIFMMPIMGISQGVQPIIGYNFGAKQYERTKETVVKAIIAGVAIAMVAYIAMFTVPEQLISIFNRSDEALAKIGARVMIISNLLLPGVAFGVIGGQYFQAIGKAKMAILLSLTRQFLFLIPAVIIMPIFLGLDGVFYAFVVSDGSAILLTCCCLGWEFRQLRKKGLLK